MNHSSSFKLSPKNIASKKLSSFSQMAVDYASRLICVAALVWFGFIVSKTISSRSQIESSASSELSSDTSSPSSASAFCLEPGQWSFAGSDFSIERSICDEAELEQQLNEILVDRSLEPILNFDATQLIEMAKLNGATKTKHETGVIWISDAAELRIRLLVTDDESPRLIAATIATKANENWQIVKTGMASKSNRYLLPMPPNTDVSCSRERENGCLQMQLLSTSSDDEQLLELWRDSGWEIRHTDWGHVDSFSYLCAKNGHVVYAWSDSNRGSRALMLSTSTSQAKPAK